MKRLSDKHLAVQPIRTFDAYPEGEADMWGTLQEARNPVFKVGDVVAVDTGYGTRRALVVDHARDYSERTGEWIVKYKVRIYKKDGTLGNSWKYAFPGIIARAFEDLKKEKADA